MASLRPAEMLKVEVVGGFICPVHPAYGKKGLAPPEDRIEMVYPPLPASLNESPNPDPRSSKSQTPYPRPTHPQGRKALDPID